ncbi:pleckstrin homology domain-containing family M member 3 isoform X2 [Lepisosteus oculatus]|uniref:pleckstrin homology domain-containing family M member 3 isoform X2 n=1 Tax=Lepisosteus oculatus TaxID=7918 RepID=UPI0035F516E5
MEGVEVEDVSPALEVTEDFLRCFDSPVENRPQQPGDYGMTGVSELEGREGFLNNLPRSNGTIHGAGGALWGLLAKEQPGRGQEGDTNNPEWADHKGAPSFSIFGMCQGKRSRARSTNDLAAHTKDPGASAFQRGHSRSRSDANYRSVTDNGVLPPSTAGSRDGHKKEGSRDAFPNLVKRGQLEQREGPAGRWSPRHVELTACELRLYSLDSSGNQQLCTAYSLSHCQSASAPLGPDGRVLQALFFNSTRLQLRASCQWEALDWRQRLWERVLAVRPQQGAQQQGEQEGGRAPAQTPSQPSRPTALPLFTQHCRDVLKAGVLYQLTDLNNWRAFTFVLSKALLQAFPTEGRGPVSEPLLRYELAGCLAVQRDDAGGGRARFQVVFAADVLRLRAETERKAQDWVEALRAAAGSRRAAPAPAPAQPGAVMLRGKAARERRHRDGQRGKRQSVTTSFLRILTCLAVEKGLTAQGFRCAGCQRPVGLSRGKAKVCYYSGWYYCQSCHEDSLFLIPARLLHNWDTSKHKVSKQAKEFLEFVYEEPLLDIQQLNPCLYEHCEALAAVLRLRQQLQSLRAYLFSCRATVAEDLRRRIFPREYLLQHIHLYSLADLQQVIDGKLAPFLSKVIKFASSHVYSCSLCSQKGFICELCQNGQIIFPFQNAATKRF